MDDVGTDELDDHGVPYLRGMTDGFVFVRPGCGPIVSKPDALHDLGRSREVEIALTLCPCLREELLGPSEVGVGVPTQRRCLGLGTAEPPSPPHERRHRRDRVFGQVELRDAPLVQV